MRAGGGSRVKVSSITATVGAQGGKRSVPPASSSQSIYDAACRWFLRAKGRKTYTSSRSFVAGFSSAVVAVVASTSCGGGACFPASSWIGIS